MTREEKIKAIYEEMANKELTFGCKLQVIESVGPIQGVIFNIVSESYKVLWDDRRISTETKNSDFSIIGHPVMIGDVLDWLDKKICLLIDQGKDIEKLLKGSDALNLRLINIWKYKTKPLDEQPDHCIDYVTNLLDKFGSVI